MAGKVLKPSPELMLRVRQAFLDYGYSGLNMVTLARACGFTRRSLYNYFNNKEQAFRASIAHDNALFIREGLAAGVSARAAGGSALDILAAVLDTRYGFARRELAKSPHTVELNAEAFKLCRDIMIEAAVNFQAELEALALELQAAGLLRLNDRFTPAQIAQLLAEAGRAVNQALPPAGADELSARYRRQCEALLYGCADPPRPAG